MYLIFDTETTGLPEKFNAPVTDLDNWPRMVQLAWQRFDSDGNLLYQQDYIIKPEGFTIPFNSEKVHGISTELAHEKGHDLTEVLEEFARELDQVDFVVGHNIEFDINVLGAEYIRKGVQSSLHETESICTKLETTEFCQIPGGRGGKYKWPQLAELYQILFNEQFEEAHNALADVAATSRAFLELLRRGAFTPERLKIDPELLENFRRLNPDVIPDFAPEIESQSPEEQKKAREAAQGDIPETPVEESTLTEAPFAHLHNHSQYSVLQSTAKIPDMIQKAVDDGMPAVGLTDHGNLFAAFKFVQEANDQGVKPVIGCEFYLTEDRTKQKFTKDEKDIRNHIPLFAKHQEGYRNLSKLCSYGYIEGLYGKYPRIDKDLLVQYKEGLIAFTGGLNGEVPYLILNKGEHEAEEAFKWWKEQFGDDFYVELQRHGLEEEKRVNEILLNFAEKYDVKAIASNNSYYIEQSDAGAHDTLLCVNSGDVRSTPIGQGRGYRFGFPNDQYYFKTQEEMKKLFHDYPVAIENIQEVIDKVEPPVLENDVLLPNYTLPEGYADQDEYLRALTFEGAKERYGEIREDVEERLNMELDIIKRMGYPGYFLIVQDFINKAKEQGVLVGPGRGSAAGSAVAYAIGITNIDPIGYNLIFERFLNPERVNMPDIDIDFDDEGRQKVIEYVVDKYGANQVAHIVTFGTMAPKMAIRDVGRVLELPLPETNTLAKMIPEKPGTTFQQALDENKELKELKEGDDLKASTLNEAETLIGSVRNIGIHAAGIIIAPDDLLEYIPVKTDKDTLLWITQFDGSVVEDAGMLKMDFLGLKTLTIIKDAIALIKKNHDIDIDIEEISLHDENTYHLYQTGQTVGTFQFESEGMRQWLVKLQPSNIEDLIAMNALYRPGPMQFIPNYIDRKHGREEVDYPHPMLEEILQNTYGIMVYQEQIMQTAQKMAGYSFGNADLLRRAMGKKKMKEMEKHKGLFIEGARDKNGIDEKKAEEVFDVMARFAEYGFNRSHSAAYSVVAYQTGYLKANYPPEYMASVLTHHQNNIDKITYFMDECRRMGVPVLGPDVNESHLNFDVNTDGEIRFGLAAIKGAGEAAVQAIIDEREQNGIYESIFDFVERVDLKAVNKKTMECLAMAGAFDCFEDFHRRQYLHNEEGEGTLIDKLVKYGNNLKNEIQSAQQSLFGGNIAQEIPKPKGPSVDPYREIDKLNFEKEVVGFYISGHPLDEFRLELEHFCTCGVGEIENYKGKEISVAGIVTKNQQRESKNGKPFGIFTIEDFNDSLDMIMFGEEYLKHQYLLTPGQFVYVRGNVQERYNQKDTWELKPHTIQLLSEVREKFANSLVLQIPLERVNERFIEDLEQLSQDYPGQCMLKMNVVDEKEKISTELLSRRYRVQPVNELFNKLEEYPDVNYRLVSA